MDYGGLAAQDGSDDGASDFAVGGGWGKIPQTATERPNGIQRPRRRTHGRPTRQQSTTHDIL